MWCGALALRQWELPLRPRRDSVSADGKVLGRGALWAQSRDAEDNSLALWKALLIAAALEILLPISVVGINWSFLPSWDNPQPIKVMSVDIREPTEETPPSPEEPPKLYKTKRLNQLTLAEVPNTLPGERPSRIQLPEPVIEAEVKPKSEPERAPDPEPEEEKVDAESEPEMPALPSVYRDVKPVKKVRIKYPPEAEEQRIQGRVKVRLSVSVEGKVTDAEIVRSEPTGVFDETVLEAVRQYIFKKDGTSYRVDQEAIFKIDD